MKRLRRRPAGRKWTWRFIRFWIDRVDAVRNVSLSLGRDEAIGIVGESGSGKSTLARILVGLQTPDSGNVTFRGRPVFGEGMTYEGDTRREVQMVFQDPYSSLNPRLTAHAAVAEACRVHQSSSRERRATKRFRSSKAWAFRGTTQ